MNPGYLTAFVDPGGSELFRQPSSTPVASQNLSDYDSKMAWVRSTLSEILQFRLQFLDAPIIDCDQRMLSLHPRRQSRATWCTNDIYTFLICIYEHYGPTRIKLEGPNPNGLSWIKFYKLFDVEQGRTKQLVHVIWIKPGEMLVNRIHEKTSAEAKKIHEGLRLTGSPTLSKCHSAVESSPTPTRSPRLDLISLPTSDLNVAPTRAISAAEPSAAMTTHTTATAAPQMGPIATASPDAASTKSEDKIGCDMPHVATDGELGSELWSERRDAPCAKTATQTPVEAKDEEWGTVSCVSMDSMDGSWTLILDEDLAW